MPADHLESVALEESQTLFGPIWLTKLLLEMLAASGVPVEPAEHNFVVALAVEPVGQVVTHFPVDGSPYGRPDEQLVATTHALGLAPASEYGLAELQAPAATHAFAVGSPYGRPDEQLVATTHALGLAPASEYGFAELQPVATTHVFVVGSWYGLAELQAPAATHAFAVWVAIWKA